MKANFLLNDYTLIWTLLFQGSVKESIYKLKQKLWVNYKEEYNLAYKDKNIILSDPKNFIPNNDTVYHSILENNDYEKIKRDTEKYRREVMKIWDTNKKKINSLFSEILRKEVYSKDTTTLLQDALMKVVEGYTTFKEVYKVVDIDFDLERSIRKDVQAEERGR